MSGATDTFSILMTDDIFPLGRYETKPVNAKKDGCAQSYPDVTVLSKIENIRSIDSEVLVLINLIGKSFVKERIDKLTPSLTVDAVKRILHDVGFTKESYQSYSLRELGTCRLKDLVKGELRRVLDAFPVDFFRPQVAVAQPGWKTLFHQDHFDFNTYGFRAMIPTNSPVFISFLRESEEIIYKLLPGNCYFVNIAKLHKGFNPSELERRNIIFQMVSDELILEENEIEPLSNREASSFSGFLSTEIHPIWGMNQI